MANDRKLFVVSEERKNKVSEVNKPSFFIDAIPGEITQYIGSFLDLKSASRYVRTCKTINHFFQPELDKEVLAELLHHVAFGEKKEVEEMLRKRPWLLYKIGVTQDPCGRMIEGTAYRIALGAKDVSVGKHEEMVEMIARYLKQRPDGEEELARQYAEQFPKGWEKQERIREVNDSAAVQKVFAAIEQSTTDKDCENAILEFRHYLKPKGMIKTGYHFNDKLLDEAYDLYDSHYDRFSGHDSRKNRLAAIKVIGGIQHDALPACDARAICDGLFNVVERKQLLSRGRMVLDDNVTPFYDDALGDSHFVYSWSGRGSWGRARFGALGALGSRVPLTGRAAFTTLMSSKNVKLAELMRAASKPKTSACVIC